MRFSIPGAAVALALAAVTAGCGTPGGSNADTSKQADKEASKTVAKPNVVDQRDGFRPEQIGAQRSERQTLPKGGFFASWVMSVVHEPE